MVSLKKFNLQLGQPAAQSVKDTTAVPDGRASERAKHAVAYVAVCRVVILQKTSGMETGLCYGVRPPFAGMSDDADNADS